MHQESRDKIIEEIVKLANSLEKNRKGDKGHRTVDRLDALRLCNELIGCQVSSPEFRHFVRWVREIKFDQDLTKRIRMILKITVTAATHLAANILYNFVKMFQYGAVGTRP